MSKRKHQKHSAKRPKNKFQSRNSDSSQKSQGFQPSHGSHRSHDRFQKKGGLSRVDSEVINLFYKSPTPLSAATIFGAKSKLSLSEKKHSLKRLLEMSIITEAGSKKFSLKRDKNLIVGIFDSHPSGFGFIHNLETGSAGKGQDPYVSEYNRAGAQHGDQILAKITHKGKNGRSEAIILAVLAEANNRLAGIVSIDQKTKKCLVFPEDRRLSFLIEVPDSHGANHGDAVIVELERSSTADQLRRGKILEVLGNPDDPAVQIRFVIEQLNLPHTFSSETENEIASIEFLGRETGDCVREDLRDIDHVTIDGATAKDFDDAVFVEKIGAGYRLYVSIADVSQYVRVGSALDRDAYDRGTSVYFPGTVVPMLPEKLSNDLCSLMPKVDRLAVTAILEFNAQGKLLKKRFCRSTIKSKQRFTYSQVQNILDDPASASIEEAYFLPMLQVAEELARILRKMRRARGALGFNIPEATILVEDGKITNITRLSPIFSRHIIEEFMLSANEAVAEFFTEKGVEALYRIHEFPDEQRVDEFRRFAASLGIKIPDGETSPAWFAEIIEQAAGTDREFVISTLLLKSMKQAKYSSENVGHFGLAATNYTHFTSPIRRYPDLMVHRELCRLIGFPESLTKNRQASRAGEFLSSRERVSIKAERESQKRLQCIFMEKYIGESFDAIISGVSDLGFYVELVDYPVYASAPIEELVDDVYLFDHRGHNLIAQNSGAFYRLGARQKVRIKRIDRARNIIIVQPLLGKDNRK